MATSRTSKRRVAGVASAKVIITSAALAATLGGWAAISATDSHTASAATLAQEGFTSPGSAPTQPFDTSPNTNQAPSSTSPFGSSGRRRRTIVPNGGTNTSPFGQVAPQPNPSAPDTTTPAAPTQPRRPLARTHSSR